MQTPLKPKKPKTLRPATKNLHTPKSDTTQPTPTHPGGETIHLNTDDAVRFVHALTQPVRFNQHLRAAMAEHDRRVISR
ncbi:DUF1778 domain-containing protein [Acanthopleuribacter pedis]|uniref:DUF1778 domain-containing protein n=1 Tax=Acanthopleuribacter pedis TaxID=442870 RepID=A0A8J7QAB2_9BACT|nr:DUF1778 domain-containing protein [Acanthopleuribacter pedis]MBO1317081.1 DUF1778 domain-containing protein [Acanthopleuribacter pedis]